VPRGVTWYLVGRASACARLAYTTTAPAPPSKGRLIRCTVPGSTRNRLAMTRTPGLPGVARAFLMRSSSSGAIRGRLSCLPSLLARASPARTSFLNDRPLELSKYAHHLKHRLAGRRRGVEPLNRSILSACSSGQETDQSCRLRPIGPPTRPWPCRIPVARRRGIACRTPVVCRGPWCR